MASRAILYDTVSPMAPETKDFVHLQSVGRVPAKRASEVKPGDVLMYNFGYTYTVLSVTPKGKSVLIVERADDSGKEYTRRRLGSTLVAWAPSRSRSQTSVPSVRLTSSQIEREVGDVVEGSHPVAQRLFVGVYPTGIVYADRQRERHGDYLRLAFPPFRTLELEWESDVLVPLGLSEEIIRHARHLQVRRGEAYEVSSSGQKVLLGR